MAFIGELLLLALNIYTFLIIAQVIISWLVAFNVLNTGNPQAVRLINFLDKVTEPVMAPIRRYVPPIGGIDITPIIVIFGIMIVERFIKIIFF
jgi:YggT family protein